MPQNSPRPQPRGHALILTGSALKAAVQTVAVFLLLLVISVTLLWHGVGYALRGELGQQVHQETQVLVDIYHKNGMPALRQALQQSYRSEGMAELYNEDFHNLRERFPHLGTARLQRGRLHIAQHQNGQYYAIKLTQLNKVNLAVGRSTQIVSVAQRRLLQGAVAMGVAFTVLALLIGYYFSRRASHKLSQFE